MQPAKPVDLLLVFAAHFVLVAAGRVLVFPGELDSVNRRFSYTYSGKGSYHARLHHRGWLLDLWLSRGLSMGSGFGALVRARAVGFSR